MNPLHDDAHRIAEGLVDLDGESFYFIPDVDRMRPFLMSVVSDGDRWMFVSSTGALTAGRESASVALFPYETDDRLHDAAGSMGPVTAIRVDGTRGTTWRPFHGVSAMSTHRSLFKSVIGDSVVFEETHRDLGLGFRYQWRSSDEFGFVRRATLANLGAGPVRITILDGLLNLLPYGLEPAVYRSRSNLTNAYKRSEVIDPTTRLAVFSLESGVVDRPEPAEVLRGTVAWSFGFDQASLSVSPDGVTRFLSGEPADAVSLLTGRRGAYLLSGSIELAPGERSTWHIVADVGKDQASVTDLRRLLEKTPDLMSTVTASTLRSSDSLVRTMAPADALQRTGDRVATAHQFANVTYNVMRGGVPLAATTSRPGTSRRS